VALAVRPASPRTSSATTAKPRPVFASPRGFDGGIQGQQVGLAGNRLDHLGDTLDVLAALAQGFDQHLAGTGALAELVHAGDSLLHHSQALVAALTHLQGGAGGLLAEQGGLLLGSNHVLRTADDAVGSLQLRAQALAQLFNRIGHLGGRQGILRGGLRQLAAELADLHGVYRARRLSRRRACPQQWQPQQQRGRQQRQQQAQVTALQGPQQKRQAQALQDGNPRDGQTARRHGKPRQRKN